jgi:tetratricopeptide (TPR) repeat protein
MRMKTGTSIIVLLVLIGLAVSPALAGVEVGIVNVKPAGDLVSGKTNVTADFQIDFISVGGETFPSDENIMLSTQLDNPIWNYAIVLDGVENPRPASSKNQLELTGWELSYKDVDEHVKVSLKGNAPKTDKSKQIEVVGVSVTSPNGRVKDQVTNVTRFLTNPTELTGDIGSVRTKVKKLQTDIAGLKADGIDTSKAEQKAKEASDALDRAAKESYASAKVFIQNADTYMKDAYAFLDMGVTQKQIAEAKEAIDRTDEWITYFNTEKNMETDPRLAPIITKREFASEYVSNAQELFDQGKYSEAKEKAESANTKATDVFDDTQELYNEVSGNTSATGSDSGSLSGLLMYLVIAIIIIAAVIGIFLFMKKKGGSGGGKGGGGGSYGRGKPSSKSKKAHQYDELF